MTVILKGSAIDNPPLAVEVIAKYGEVRLRYNGHDFVRCFTDVSDGQHKVCIFDADTGQISNTLHSIPSICWRR